MGEAANFAETIQMLKELKPHVIIMDLRMPDETRTTALEVKSLLTSGESRLLAISVWHDEDADRLAESFGAATLIDKMNLSSRLLPTIALLASQNAGVQPSSAKSCSYLATSHRSPES